MQECLCAFDREREIELEKKRELWKADLAELGQKRDFEREQEDAHG